MKWGETGESRASASIFVYPSTQCCCTSSVTERLILVLQVDRRCSEGRIPAILWEINDFKETSKAPTKPCKQVKRASSSYALHVLVDNQTRRSSSSDKRKKGRNTGRSWYSVPNVVMFLGLMLLLLFNDIHFSISQEWSFLAIKIMQKIHF